MMLGEKKGGQLVFNLCKIQFANFTAINKEPAATKEKKR